MFRFYEPVRPLAPDRSAETYDDYLLTEVVVEGPATRPWAGAEKSVAVAPKWKRLRSRTEPKLA
jgi:hypothetical protein